MKCTGACWTAFGVVVGDWWSEPRVLSDSRLAIDDVHRDVVKEGGKMRWSCEDSSVESVRSTSLARIRAEQVRWMNRLAHRAAQGPRNASTTTREGASDNLAPGSARGSGDEENVRPRRRPRQHVPRAICGGRRRGRTSWSNPYPGQSAGLDCVVRLRARRALDLGDTRTLPSPIKRRRRRLLVSTAMTMIYFDDFFDCHSARRAARAALSVWNCAL
jgi:hypothetical protein